jgi:hypothetical protein
MQNSFSLVKSELNGDRLTPRQLLMTQTLSL